MEWEFIPIISGVVAAITILSGFGLGTVLMPAFAMFIPVEVTIAATGVVDFVSNLFKLGLVGRHADRGEVLRFGMPAVVAAAVGAWVLANLAPSDPLTTWSLGSRGAETPRARQLSPQILGMWPISRRVV